MHFVNSSAFAAPALTFGTYTVLNVNTTPRRAAVLTKCTPSRAALNAQLKFVPARP